MVKEIESIRTELHVDSLGYLGVFDQRQIQVRESGTIESVAAQIAESVWSRRGKRCRGIANPLGRVSADLHWPYQIRANGIASARRVGRGEYDVERTPALYCQDRRQFPSAHEAIAFEGQIVDGIRNEPVPGVEIGRPAAAENVGAVLNDNSRVGARQFVDRVRVRVGRVELQSMLHALVRRYPEGVVVRIGIAVALCDSV